MTRRRVQRYPFRIGLVLGAERIGRAEPGVRERPVEMALQFVRLAERDQP